MSEHTCVGIDMGVCQGAMFRTVRNTDSYFQGGGSNLLYTDDLSRILDTCNWPELTSSLQCLQKYISH